MLVVVVKPPVVPPVVTPMELPEPLVVDVPESLATVGPLPVVEPPFIKPPNARSGRLLANVCKSAFWSNNDDDADGLAVAVVALDGVEVSVPVVDESSATF